MTDFTSLAFQSSLSTEAILFGVFGFLYAVFANYIIMPDRPRVVPVLRRVCRTIAWFIVGNAALNVCSLIFLSYYSKVIGGAGNIFLALGFGVITIAIALFCLVWAYRYMRN